MTWDNDGYRCDGCQGAVVDGPSLVTFREGDSLTVANHYHRSCWLTGWYAGIAPKGEFPEPEKACEVWGCDLPFGHNKGQVDIPENHGGSDPVNHPGHYTWLKNGVEVIDITENFNFLLGNVLKYVMRADHKGKPLEDLKKAVWYLEREIANREAAE